MKYIITLFTVAFSLAMSSQSLSIMNPVDMVEGTLAEIGPSGELEVAWAMQNISSSSLTVRCRREVLSAVAGSTNYFCWGVCFQESTDVSPVGAAVPMNANVINNSFYGHYKPNGNAGQSTIRYCFFNMDNPNDEVCHTVNFCADVACIVGVEEHGKPEISALSPNPANAMTSFSYSLPKGATDARVMIYSLTGAIIRNESLISREGMIMMNATDFANGVYFVTVVADGVASQMQKMVISH
jgi:hypothetical protein